MWHLWLSTSSGWKSAALALSRLNPSTLPKLPIASSLVLLFALAGCSREVVYFCPDEACAEQLQHEMRVASTSVHVAIAYFNHEGIADAIIEAHQRGLEVMVLGEGSESVPPSTTVEGGINYLQVRRLIEAGVPYRDDTNPYIMHNKFTIVDGQTVATGSFNYTNAADERNHENLIILSGSKLADSYESEFVRLWELGVEPSWASSVQRPAPR